MKTPRRFGEPSCPNCVYVGGWEEVSADIDGGYEIYYCHDHHFMFDGVSRSASLPTVVFRFRRIGEAPDETPNRICDLFAWTNRKAPYAWSGWGKAILLCAPYIDKRRLDEAFS